MIILALFLYFIGFPLLCVYLFTDKLTICNIKKTYYVIFGEDNEK